MRARRDEQGSPDLHGRRQRIVRVGREDDVDALAPAGKLAVDVEAVVRQQHHHLGAWRRASTTVLRRSSSRMPNDHFGIIQRGLAIGV